MGILLFRYFGTVERAQALQKEPCLAARRQEPAERPDLLNEMSVPVCIAATVAIAGTSSSCCSHQGSAHVGVAHGCADLVDFLNGQFPRSCACQYSVVLSRHVFLLFLATSALLLYNSDLRTNRVLVRAAFGQMSKRQAAGWAGGAYAFDFFLR